MRRLRAWLMRMGGVFGNATREREFSEEIESNIQLHVDDNIRSGMDPVQARRVALLKLGSRDATAEAWRDQRGSPLLDTLVRDIAHSLRVLYQNKAWTVVAISSLALGIGANTALFSFVSGILLEKLPVRNPDELVVFRWAGQNSVAAGARSYGYLTAEQGEGPAGLSFSFAAFDRFRNANQTLTAVFAFAPSPSLNVIVGGESEIATGHFVSGNYYTALGLSAERGRTLIPSDDSASALPVVVFSHEYWERRFGMDPKIVGAAIVINKVSFRVAGIMVPGIPNPLRVGLNLAPDITIPLAKEPLFPDRRSELNQPWLWWITVMGRLKSGATAGQAVANFESIFQQTAREGRNAYLASQPSQSQASGDEQMPRLGIVNGSRGVYEVSPQIKRALAILGVILGIVLLIVCVNLANLFLSKAAARQKEIAVRMAIGASRARLIRQLLTESIVLAVFGGLLGLVVASWCRGLLPTSVPSSLTNLDARVLFFAVVITGFTGLAFGIMPALRATRLDCISVVQAGAGRFSRSRSRLSKALLVIQVGMSLLLLIAAGLFVRSLLNLQKASAGFNPNNLALVTIDRRSGQADEVRAATVYRQILDELRATQGVRSASFSSFALLNGFSRTANISLGDADPDAPPTRVNTMTVHEDFFATLEIPLRLGRGFTAQDRQGGPQVALVNQAFVSRLLSNSNPIGRRLGTIEIVGVVADAKYARLREDAEPVLYRPYQQTPLGSGITFEVRTAGEPETLLSTIRDIVKRVDPNLPVLRVSTQVIAIEESALQERIIARASTVFGGLALTIAMIGLYGLMSYSVTERTREIGIRMALGAEGKEVLRSVLSETLFLVGIGVAIGLIAAFAATPLIASLLFDLVPHDPATIIAAILLMVGVAAIAGYLPARRASRIDPLVALKYE